MPTRSSAPPAQPGDLGTLGAYRVPAEGHLCCGSAGTYNLVQPAIAAQLKARKLANIARTKPDLVAAGNIGCITQLQGDTPVIHTVQLLDWMAGGPAPANLPAPADAPPSARVPA